MDVKNRLLSVVVFEDNEWLDKYCELINEGKKKEKKSNEPIQIHHILPRFFYKRLGVPVDNSLENTVELSFNQHILAHYLLYNCSLGDMKQANLNAFALLTRGKQIENFDAMDVEKQKEAYQKWIDSLSKAVICLETKEFYSSAKEACRKTGVDYSSISKCCKGRKLTAGGYHWKFFEDYNNNVEIKYIGGYKKHKKTRIQEPTLPIKVINLDTNKIYDSVSQAGRDTNTNESCIRDVLRGKCCTAGGYRWQRYEDYLAGKVIDTSRKKTKSVRNIETNATYPSIAEASRQMKIDKSQIARCCRGESKTAGGYHWEYA